MEEPISTRQPSIAGNDTPITVMKTETIGKYNLTTETYAEEPDSNGSIHVKLHTPFHSNTGESFSE
eukprot:gene950-7914_t